MTKDEMCQEIFDAILEDNRSIIDDMTIDVLIYGKLDEGKWRTKIEAEFVGPQTDIYAKSPTASEPAE